MSFKTRITASRLDKVDIKSMIIMDALGNLSFDLMKKRVTQQHDSTGGRSLPAYKVRTYKKRGDLAVRPWSVRKEAVHGWDESKAPPPDIWVQIRKLGGVVKKGTDWKGGTPIRYSDRSPVREKRGQIWGYQWPTREEYFRENYGGSQVDHLRTGSMWASRKVRARATTSGKPKVTVGFAGAVPKGSIFSLLRDGPGKTKTGRQRKVTASYKALLANSRGPDGSFTMTNPVEWLGMTDKEMGLVLRKLDRDLMKKLDSIPIEVKVVS